MCILPYVRLPDLPPSITPKEPRPACPITPAETRPQRTAQHPQPLPSMDTDSNTPRGTETRPAAEDARREGEKRKRRTPQHPPQRPGAYQPRPSRRAADDLPEAAQPEPVPASHSAAARQSSRAERERGRRGKSEEQAGSTEPPTVKVINTPNPSPSNAPPHLPPVCRTACPPSPSQASRPPSCCRRFNSAFGEKTEPRPILPRIYTGKQPTAPGIIAHHRRGSLYIFNLAPYLRYVSSTLLSTRNPSHPFDSSLGLTAVQTQTLEELNLT